jgi:hypothetical protein
VLPPAAILLSCLLFTTGARAQSDPLYIDGPYYISGPTAEFYGDLILGPNAQIYFEDGTTVYLYGVNFTVDPAAKIFGADLTWTTFTEGGGTANLILQQPNPNDNSTVQQMLNGGNTAGPGGLPSLPNLQINNPNGAALTGADTRVSGTLSFTSGSLMLGGQNLELGPSAALNGNSSSMHIISDGTGYLVREGLADGASFTFPISKTAGDYTPVTLTNKGGAVNDYYAQVTDYAGSAPAEYAAVGIDRSWNIYATNSTLSNVSLSHNTATGGGSFSEVNAFVTQQTAAGGWLQGPPVNTTGNPVNNGVTGGVSTQSRDLTLAASGSANAAWISVSSDAQNALPITLTDFTARAVNGQSLLEWSTLNESNSSYFNVQHSRTGGSWLNIGRVDAAGQSSNRLNYQYTHANPATGINYYRLQLVDKDGRFEYSSVRSVDFKASGDMLLVPNPTGSSTGNHVKVLLPASLGSTGRIQVYNSAGQLILSRAAGGLQVVELDVALLAQGMYQVVASDAGQNIYCKPLIKQ